MIQPSIINESAAHVTREDFRWDPTAQPKPSRVVQFIRLSSALSALANTRREKSMHDEVRPLVTHLMEILP